MVDQLVSRIYGPIRSTFADLNVKEALHLFRTNPSILNFNFPSQIINEINATPISLDLKT